MPNLRAFIKFCAFSILILLIVPAQLIILACHKGCSSYILPHLWHKTTLFIFGIKTEMSGTPETHGQIIYISNHISYLDIPVIGSIIKASFVAKKDVESWPVFGFLSKLQQTAFISRSKNDAVKEKNNLNAMIEEQKSLIIFPEGTSTDGREVRQFKSSLFSISYRDNSPPIPIQPMTLQVIETDKQKIDTQKNRDLYAWHIGMDTPLHKHLWRFAKCRGATIKIQFHPIISPTEHSNRKELAKACHSTVSSVLR